MNRKNNKTKNNKPKNQETIGYGRIRITRIPEENIINLREIFHEKEREAEEKKKIKADFLEFAEKNWFMKFWEKLKNIKLPEIKKKKLPEVKVIKTNEKAVKPIILLETKEKIKPLIKKIKFEPSFFRIPPIKDLIKPLLSFVIVSLLLVLPIYIFFTYGKLNQVKGKVLGESSQAYGSLESAGLELKNSNYDLASEKFIQATESFIQAQNEIKSMGSILANILNTISSKVRSAQYILKAGQYIGEAGDRLTSVIKGLSDLELLSSEEKTEKNINLTSSLSIIIDNFKPAQEKILLAIENLKKVEIKDIPENEREKVKKIQDLAPALENDLKAFSSISEVLLEILGNDSSKRYLILFQNNREIRPTGGFIGAYALVDIYQGKIENLEVPGGGSYDVAGQLKEKIIAPKPLHLVNPYWNIQDANWFIDFPTSAQKIMWFFERGGGATVDGVITLTPTVIEDLLKIVGPIDMTEVYGVKVDHDNFVREAQTWAEVKYDPLENKPKKFVADLMPKLLEKVFNTSTDQLLEILKTFNQALLEKQIIFYFGDKSLEDKIISLGWAGEVKNTSKDYLAMVNTNIAGGKTDAVIDQLIKHQSEIQSDGSIIDTVTVDRIHHGNLIDRWEKVRNIDYIRFYVPKGSELIDAFGFETIPYYRFQLPDNDAVSDSLLEEIEKNSMIDEKSNTRMTEEFGKTVFGNWVGVGPGEKATVMIKYKLPFKIEPEGLFNKTDNYSLFIQKQPGSLNTFLISKLIYPDNYEIIWQYPELKSGGNFVQFNADLNTDKYWAVVLKK